MEKFEIVELGYPQSIIQRENEPITALIETELILQQLQNRIKELEGTIENMKAIAGEKIEPINGATSVDYPNDNTTELITVTEEVYSGCFSEITKTKCCGIAPIINENYCPNCGRKIKK